ncbi:hypothetical protein [Magnetospirillum sp. UT-4]|uniref:hypothetical protein n=1 Tax=Magnetospirillum sp. UT-4 TaxID=2681467 RepID=UPI00137E391C|nr:hypothetical protein [Magnetospirillum sp. UT-4]CAA7613204.1 hypothetical protein MTBUT4_130014 [Magnetospirillum sp. UT-4]
MTTGTPNPQERPRQRSTLLPLRLWRRFVQSINWDLSIVCLCFAAALPLADGGLPLGLSAWRMVFPPQQRDDMAAFAQAQILAPRSEPAPLVALDATKTTTFVALKARPPEKGTANGYIWVAVSEDLRRKCVGKPSPARALHRILGLHPAVDPDERLYEITLPADKVFRPCLSGHDITTTACTRPPPAPAAAPLPSVHQVFIVRNLAANAVRVNYPFTGMGYTYDWSLDSPDNVGVSEFVIPAGTDITPGPPITPEAFCRPGALPT